MSNVPRVMINDGRRNQTTKKPFKAPIPRPAAKAIINAAAAATDYRSAVDHLVQKEGWHLAFTDFQSLIRDQLGRALVAAGTVDADALNDERNAALAYFLTAYQAKSPIAIFDPEGVRSALFAAWQDAAKKGDVAAIVPSP